MLSRSRTFGASGVPLLSVIKATNKQRPLQEKAYLCARVPNPQRRGDRFLDVGIFSAPAAGLTVMQGWKYVDLAHEEGNNYHEAARKMLARMERSPRFRALLHYPGMRQQKADMLRIDEGAAVFVAGQIPGVRE